MVDHDFTVLNDKEFELFAADLLSAHETKRFERFKPGKDQGVDGRYFSDGQEVILQCKHWPGSQLKALISKLKRTEANNVKKLNPTRYLLAITHPLSRVDRARIAQVSRKFNLELAAAEYFAQEDDTVQENSASVPRASFDLEIEDLFDISNLLGNIKNRPKKDTPTAH
jgi:hypothetical protein